MPFFHLPWQLSGLAVLVICLPLNALVPTITCILKHYPYKTCLAWLKRVAIKAWKYALSAINVCGSCKIWFSPQGLVHHGPIPDTADGAKGHKGEPCQWDPQWDQGTNLVWKRKRDRKKTKVKDILDKVLKMYAWEQPFMEMIGDIRQESNWIPTRGRFFFVSPPAFNKNQVQEGRDNCFETVPVLGRHSGDLTPS